MPLDQKQIVAVADKIEKLTKQVNTTFIYINTQQQQLYFIADLTVSINYSISTSKFGLGCTVDSLQTPVGLHSIAEKIGADAAINTVFVARQASGEIAQINSPVSQSQDEITSRILWLQGEEQHINKGGEVDSYQRYIYIHGTSDEAAIGKPASIGCIRMLNKDVIDLFSKVAIGCYVYIE